MARLRLPLIFFVSALLLPLGAAAQQPAGTSSICVLAFQDSNENGVRDEGEMPLPNVPVTIAVETETIVATHVTTQEPTPYCFEGLMPGVYNLTFQDTINHRATTQSGAAISLDVNQRVRVEFGAVSEPSLLESPGTEDTGGEMEPTTRLLLAALGAAFAMIFMVGFGSVVMSIIY